MEILSLVLLLGLLPAYIAYRKGRNLFIWWLYGVCFLIIALPHSILLKNKLNKQNKICPQCAEQIKREAVICRFCGYSFSNSKSTETTSEISFLEWKKNNQDKTLNDYYKENKTTTSQIIISNENLEAKITKQEKSKLLLAFIVVVIITLAISFNFKTIKEKGRNLNFKEEKHINDTFNNRHAEIEKISEYVTNNIENLINSAYKEYLDLTLPNTTSTEKNIYFKNAKKELQIISKEESEKIMQTVIENNINFNQIRKVIESNEFKNTILQGIRNKYKNAKEEEIIKISTKSDYKVLNVNLENYYKSIAKSLPDKPYEYYAKGSLNLNNKNLEGYFHITTLIVKDNNSYYTLKSTIYFQNNSNQVGTFENYIIREIKNQTNTLKSSELNFVYDNLVKSSKLFVCSSFISSCHFEEYWGD